MQAQPQTSIIIPTLRGIQWLPRCVAALQAQTVQDFEVIVVDDGSCDGSREWLADLSWGRLRVLRNEKSTGFAAACNLGMRASDTPFVALLNDDAFPEPGWLNALLNAINTQPNTGAAASCMVFDSDPQVVQSAGIAIDRAAIAWDRLRGQPTNSAGARRACTVFGASGGAAMYRRDMLNHSGLFEESFFMYLEDVDLAWRAQRNGWQCQYAPDAIVRHMMSATSIEGSPFKHQLLGRNKIWLARRNARARDWPAIVAYDALAVLWAGMTRGEWSHLRGRIAGWGKSVNLPIKTRAKRETHLPFDPLVPPWQVVARMKGTQHA